jgi:asparagine synthase (glutamine-hydrolysing)
MSAALECRGPDDKGSWSSEQALLTHRSLAILDPGNARQPMTSGQQDQHPTVLLHSGEIYNFRELRDELEAHGHRFATNSDTEVVLKAYAEWGEDAISRFVGMFAIAIWDQAAARLILARDQLGVKPLYWSVVGETLIFASEAKGILESGIVKPRMTSAGLRELISMTKNPAQPIWADVMEVEPGTYIVHDRRGTRAVRYWRLSTEPLEGNVSESVTRTRQLIDRIVADQCTADVPLGALLSGGIDSSVLSILGARELRKRGQTLSTYSLNFSGHEEGFVETELRPDPDPPYARAVAGAAGADHHELSIGMSELADLSCREKVVRAYDLPYTHGDMDASLLRLFSAASGHVKVLLCGESADELFGGYHQFFSPRVRHSEEFPWLADAHLPQYAVSTLAPTIYTADVLRELRLDEYIRDQYSTAAAEVEPSEADDAVERTTRRISYLYLTRFLRLLLDRQDRISMSVGVEVRVPYCDPRLVTSIYNTPWSHKTHDGREKALLRSAFSTDLPSTVLHRKKSPYPSPQDATYMARLQDQCRALLSSPAHRVFDLIRRDAVQAATDANPTGNTFDRYVLERVLDFYVWLEMYRPSL